MTTKLLAATILLGSTTPVFAGEVSDYDRELAQVSLKKSEPTTTKAVEAPKPCSCECQRK